MYYQCKNRTAGPQEVQSPFLFSHVGMHLLFVPRCLGVQSCSSGGSSCHSRPAGNECESSWTRGVARWMFRGSVNNRYRRRTYLEVSVESHRYRRRFEPMSLLLREFETCNVVQVKGLYFLPTVYAPRRLDIEDSALQSFISERKQFSCISERIQFMKGSGG